MIGTIRKHSSWLWVVIIIVTVIAFFWWGAAVPSRNGSGGVATGEFGSIYGEKVTEQEYLNAKHDFYIFYWFHNGYVWPDRDPNFSNLQMDQQIYLRIMLLRKASNLGIYADDKAAQVAATSMLSSPDLTRAFRIKGRPVPIDSFIKGVLEPAGLTADDLARFARNDLILQQLVQSIGLAGQLFTPQEATAAWLRYHEERKTQIVFFNATNYISRFRVIPEYVAEYYTNYMADYRVPDRVQVSYVEFNVTNYLASAEKQIGATNLDYQVNTLFTENGMDAVPDAKTPDEAKAQIREYIIRTKAMEIAAQGANNFANAAFGVAQPTAESFTTAAKQNELVVKTPAPFSEQYGPSEFMAPEPFVKAAFALTSDEPFAGPVQGPYAYYVMELDKQLPSVIPPLSRIHDQVQSDYEMQIGIEVAQNDGTNFFNSVHLNQGSGHDFAYTCSSMHKQPVELPPFSLSTDKLPELGGLAGLPQVKQAAFSTPVGQISNFEPTDNGGFIIYVENQMPADETAMKSEMPQFLAETRREQAYDIFQNWVSLEANRELRNIPALMKPDTTGAR
jgi:hypothetical protein